MHISTATALHSIYVSLMKLGSWMKLMGWSSFLFCCNSGILFCMIKAWINSLMFSTPSSQLTKWANIEEQFLSFFLHFSTLFVQPEYKGTLSFIGNHCQGAKNFDDCSRISYDTEFFEFPLQRTDIHLVNDKRSLSRKKNWMAKREENTTIRVKLLDPYLQEVTPRRIIRAIFLH